MDLQDRVELAKIAYASYGKMTDFKNFRGDPMLEWDDLGEAIQGAWVAAAAAVAAGALSEMAGKIDKGPTFPLPPSVISALVRERADDYTRPAA
jgi:hypothetical protein